MTNLDLVTAPPEMTARWLRIAATDLRIRSMTALPNDDFDLYAIGESLDALAEQLAPQDHLPTPNEITAHITEWAKVPTSFELAEREQDTEADRA